MRKALAWLRARADNVAVGLLTVMFISFVIQIVSRYVLNSPVDWTLELCLTTWLWVVFWEAAFLLEDRDHIRFDLVYLTAGNRLRRVLAILAALAIIVAFVVSLPATWGYIGFEKIRHSDTLHVRLDYVFSIYGVFMLATVARYALRLWRALRGEDVDAPAVDAEP
jgi:TRAP-type C4-dicarboxylate transport system permease small subunit